MLALGSARVLQKIDPDRVIAGEMGDAACCYLTRANLSPLYGVELRVWPAAGSADTELSVMMEPEVCHGEAKIYAGVQG